MAITALIVSCGTNKNPKTERQMKDRIEFLEYQVHVRDMEIKHLKEKRK